MTSELSRIKYPFEYEVSPTELNKGTSWVTLKLRNIGRETIGALDIQLHSLDTYNLTVYGTWGFVAGHYLQELGSNEESKLVFRVNAIGSAEVLATINARKDGDYFFWESGWNLIRVTEEKAEIERLLVLSHPYTKIGKTLSAEATIKG